MESIGEASRKNKEGAIEAAGEPLQICGNVQGGRAGCSQRTLRRQQQPGSSAAGRHDGLRVAAARHAQCTAVHRRAAHRRLAGRPLLLTHLALLRKGLHAQQHKAERQALHRREG